MNLLYVKSKGRMERLTFLIIAVLSISLLIVSLMFIVNSARSYVQTNKNTHFTLAMNDLLSGCLDLMFVRGRLNVVLSRKEPISKDDTNFLADRFIKADGLIHSGISELDNLFPALADQLKESYKELLFLKEKGLLEAQKPFNERDHSIRTQWLNAANGFIESTGNKFLEISLKNKQDGYAFTFQRILVLAVSYRNYYGSKASQITSLMEQRKIISFDELTPILILDGRMSEVWLHIQLYAQSVDNARLNETLQEVNRLCFGPYYDNLTAVQKALIEGSPLPIDPKNLASQSAIALDSINILLNTVFYEAMKHSEHTIRKALQVLAGGLFVLLWSLAIILLAPLFLRRKVFGPIDEVMHKLKDACNLASTESAADNELLVLSKAADLLISKVAEVNKSNREIRRIADRDA
ncbi:MAG TPA: hypothetical protein VJ861_02845, partial [Treponemataceae bacterium]|nr:hypothetical protein [Treponemataceae bacterium]